jgi:hypothetical protein
VRNRANKGREALLFLKKKKQKNFMTLDCGVGATLGPEKPKVFWFFFSKKNTLP